MEALEELAHNINALALEHYATALDYDLDSRAHVIALLLAAAWIAAEEGIADPWSPRRAPAARRLAPVPRAELLAYAAEIVDGWRAYRPQRPRLVLIRGGRT